MNSNRIGSVCPASETTLKHTEAVCFNMILIEIICYSMEPANTNETKPNQP